MRNREDPQSIGEIITHRGQEYRIEEVFRLGDVSDTFRVVSCDHLSGDSFTLKRYDRAYDSAGFEESVEIRRKLATVLDRALAVFHSYDATARSTLHEYIPGDSLNKLDSNLDKRETLLADKILMIRDQLEAMLLPVGICMEHGVAHCDVHKKNAVKGQNGVVRFIDGDHLTRIGDDKNARVGTAFGTPDTMSPEIIGGNHPSLTTDIYALGCIALYDLDRVFLKGSWARERGMMNLLVDKVTDRFFTPVHRSTLGHWLSQSSDDIRPVLHGINQFIEKALMKAPEVRPQSLREALELLSSRPNITQI